LIESDKAEERLREFGAGMWTTELNKEVTGETVRKKKQKDRWARTGWKPTMEVECEKITYKALDTGTGYGTKIIAPFTTRLPEKCERGG